MEDERLDVNGLGEISFKKDYENRVGRGALGDVYKSHDKQYVIKLSTSESYQERLITEYSMTNKLYQAQETAYTPPIYQSVDGKALVMPFYRDSFNKQLSNTLQTSLLDGEKLALRAAEQYLSVLLALGKLDYTCLDRKADDIFWDEAAKKIIIIDWNILDDTQPENLKAQLLRFAQLWYEMLTGYVSRSPFYPFDDPIWRSNFKPEDSGVISIGFRIILQEAAITPNPDFSFYTQLQAKIKNWASKLDRAAYLTENDIKDIFPLLSPAENQAIREDLLFRAGKSHRRAEAMQQLQGNVQGQLAKIPDFLKQGQYPQALELIKQILEPKDHLSEQNIMAALKAFDSSKKEKGQIYRWFLLIVALKADSESGKDELRAERNQLIEYVEILNRSHHEDASLLAYVKDKLAKQKSDALTLLAKEAEILHQFQVFQDSQNIKDWDLKRLQLAKQIWENQGDYTFTDWEDHLHAPISFSGDTTSFVKFVNHYLENRVVPKLKEILENGASPNELARRKRQFLAEVETWQPNPNTLTIISKRLDSYFNLAQKTADLKLEMESSPSSPRFTWLVSEIIRRKEELESENPFASLLAKPYESYLSHFVNAYINLGTREKPNWIILEDYRRQILFYQKNNEETLKKLNLGLETGCFERVSEVRNSSDYFIAAWKKQPDATQIAKGLIDLHKKCIYLGDGEVDEVFMDALNKTLQEWLETINRHNETFQSGLGNSLLQFTQTLEGKQTGLFEDLEKKQKELEHNLRKSEETLSQQQKIAEIYTHLAVYDIERAEEAFTQIRNILSQEQKKEIVNRITEINNQGGMELHYAYQQLVLQNEPLEAAARQAFTERLIMGNAPDLGLLLSQDLHLRKTDPTQAELYSAFQQENAEQFQMLKHVVLTFVEITERDFSASDINTMIKQLDSLKLNADLGGFLYANVFAEWAKLMMETRMGKEKLEKLRADAKKPELALDELVHLMQKLQPEVFFILYENWKKQFQEKSQKLKNTGKIFEFFEVEAKEKADFGQRLFKRYQRVLGSHHGE